MFGFTAGATCRFECPGIQGTPCKLPEVSPTPKHHPKSSRMKIRLHLLPAAIVFAAVLFAANLASAVLIGPYTTNSTTLHLWHFDAAGTTTPDEVLVNNLTVTNAAQSQVPGSTITLGNPAVLAAFGSSVHIIPTNLFAGFTYAFATTNTGTTLNTTPFRDASSGAFTFEALINMDAPPTNNNGNWEIISGDSGNPSRSWQFRINTGGAGTQLPRLEFNSITASGGAMGN